MVRFWWVIGWVGKKDWLLSPSAIIIWVRDNYKTVNCFLMFTAIYQCWLKSKVICYVKTERKKINEAGFKLTIFYTIMGSLGEKLPKLLSINHKGVKIGNAPSGKWYSFIEMCSCFIHTNPLCLQCNISLRGQPSKNTTNPSSCPF